MKLMLLSDLHLGKKLNEYSLLDDQAYILQEILNLMDLHTPDGLIIAGDVYDKAAPPAEAVRLLDRFITEVAKRDIHLFMIAGNHDSADRLAFGAGLFKSRNVHIAESFREPIQPMVWRVGSQTAHIYLMPFIKPVQVRAVWPDLDCRSYDEAIGIVTKAMEKDDKVCNILVAHQFIAGAERCDSDDILVGGLDQVDVRHFEGFDLVALGHLHGPQAIGRDTVRYAGSPLKYSFSEALHHKSVPLVTIGPDKQIETQLLPLRPVRDMRVIRGPFASVSDPKVYQAGNVEDYVQITLTDEQDIPDALNKLRRIYPNLLKLNYDNARTKSQQAIFGSAQVHRRSPIELFADFFEMQNNQTLDERQGRYIRDLFDAMEVSE